MLTPVVLLVFNRPVLTRRVFAEIARARPERLFVVADGPRFPEEAEKCRQTRAVIEEVDWPCEVLTNYADSNLGCQLRVTSGLDWVFSQCEEAIIFEDDCMPDPTFFPFCEELLARYRDDRRIMMISGNNFQDGIQRGKGSYYFSRFSHTWGWATWSRTWSRYDVTISRWPSLRESNWLYRLWRSEAVEAYWRPIFDAMHAGVKDIWDVQFLFTTWASDALAVLPNVNLVSNIGFGPDSTHTCNSSSPDSNRAVRPISFPLIHPTSMKPDRAADRYTHQHHYHVNDVPAMIAAAQKIRARAKIRTRAMSILRRAKHLRPG